MIWNLSYDDRAGKVRISWDELVSRFRVPMWPNLNFEKSSESKNKLRRVRTYNQSRISTVKRARKVRISWEE